MEGHLPAILPFFQWVEVVLQTGILVAWHRWSNNYSGSLSLCRLEE
jgi:hypothetical protein